jgi:ferrochelatase
MKSGEIENTCVLLFGFGGLTSLKDIYSFLESIIGTAPEKIQVERLRNRYNLIGGSSPLVNITFNQAKELEKKLKEKRLNLKVFVSMLHGKPEVKDTLIKIKNKNIKSIITIIMNPYYVPAIIETYERSLEKAIREHGPYFNLSYVEPWHTHPLYLDSIREKIIKGLSKFPEDRRDMVEIIFSSHSIPQESEKVSSYLYCLTETIKALQPLAKGHLAFQSQGSIDKRWLGPSLSTTIKNLYNKGVRDILLVPLGFVSDHLETLYDLDIIAKKEAESLGINLVRADSLNDSSEFIEALSFIIIENFKIWKKQKKE